MCTESVVLTDFNGKHVHIEKGVEIILPINALHRHPDFYKHPDEFNPEHFLENPGTVKRLTNTGVFIPFGNGPRQCIGLRVGITQIKTVLYNLVGKYEFSIQPTKKIPILPNALLVFNHNNAELRIKLLP